VNKPSRTHALWEKQDRHTGDRWRLFQAVSAVFKAQSVLYPGSYVDLAASFVYPSVTYVDMDKRANAFFADTDAIDQILMEHGVEPEERDVRFIHSDYCSLDLPVQGFDLLISLYAGFISEPCTGFLRIGGYLLVSPGHGDAAIASVDKRYEFVGAVLSHDGDYRVQTADLGRYLIPGKQLLVTPELIHQLSRGIAYTNPAFAYVFKRTH